MTALARAGVVGVCLPIAGLYLGGRSTPARALIEAGVAVAVATDFNPGSAPSHHLPLALLLAATRLHLSPAEVVKAATRYADYNRTKQPGYSGMGTTLSANPLQFAAMRATLEEVMTQENYERMDHLARRLDAGLTGVIDRYRLPWHVSRVGARVEFICAPGPLRNGGEAEAAHAPELEAAIHVALVNQGVLIAPFHNMMLISPATTGAQVNRLITAFAAVAARLAA